MARVSANEIRKEGWINKESAVLRQFRKRWLVLTPERLYTFKRERSYTDPTEACSPPAWQHSTACTRDAADWVHARGRGIGCVYAAERYVRRGGCAVQEVDLRQCGTVKSADDMTNRPFSFTGGRTWRTHPPARISSSRVDGPCCRATCICAPKPS